MNPTTTLKKRQPSLNGQNSSPQPAEEIQQTAEEAPAAEEEAATQVAVAKLGLDIGNHDVKAVWIKDGKVIVRVFNSAFSLAQDQEGKDATGLTSRVRVTTFTCAGPDGREQSYFVGDEAKYGLGRAWVPTTDDRITGHDDLRLMLYTVMARFKIRARLDQPPPTVYLSAGLPLHLSDQGSKVAKIWEGTHQVKINGTSYHVHIAGVKTMSQPHGGLIDYFFLDSGLKNPEREAGLKGALGIIDIGSRTTDVVRLVYNPGQKKMLIDREHTVGINDLGAQNFYHIVYRTIYDRQRRNLADEVLVEAVQNRAFRHRNQMVPIDDIIQDAAGQVVEKLASDIIRKAGWTDEVVADTDTILAIGGTALLLKEAMAARLNYVTIPANAQISTACGLAKAAIMKGYFPDE